VDCTGDVLPTSCCYYGAGRVLLCDWQGWQQRDDIGSIEPFLLLGNVGFSRDFRDIGEAARLDIDVRTKSNVLPRYDGCGGEQCATEQLEGIDITLGIDCLSEENLALAFAANVQPVVDISESMTIRRLNALVQCARRPMSLLFDAVNAIDGSQTLVFVPKIKFSIIKNRRFISDDFGEITLTGRILHAGAVAAGHSPWWEETTLRCLPPPSVELPPDPIPT
jgi:hypothetical protein